MPCHRNVAAMLLLGSRISVACVSEAIVNYVRCYRPDALIERVGMIPHGDLEIWH